MPYTVNNKLAFYHPPKTASQWVRAVLRKLDVEIKDIPSPGASPDHATPWHAPSDLPKVVTIRHPLSWYESCWRYQVQHNWQIWEPGVWHPYRHIEHIKSDDFNAWVTRVAGFYGFMMRDYVTKGTDPHERQFVRQESVSWDLSCALAFNEAANIDGIARVLQETPPINQSDPIPITWTEENRQRVLERDRWFIERYYPAEAT